MSGKSNRTEDEAVANFCKILDEASQMTRYMTYMLALEDFEILPGCYDFALLDRLVDAAADRGCALTIRLGIHFRSGSGKDFTFLRYSRQRNFDGFPILCHDGIYGGGFSLTDDEYIAGWLRAFKALHDRYEKHPGFQGYYVMQPCGEWTVADKPWEGIVAGYESTTVAAFRKHLQNELGLSLEALNKRWGSAFASWEEVVPPTPAYKDGRKPDLSLAWYDFNKFKMGLQKSWFVKAVNYIRSFDPNHVIIVYGEENAALNGLADYYHNGGNHFLQNEGRFVDAWDKGTGWITEPHHPHGWAAYGDPGERGWVLDWSVYVMTAQAGGGGANLHIYYRPDNLVPGNPLYLPSHYGRWFAYDRFEHFKPILRELYSVKLVQPPKSVAVLQDPMTLVCKHRTTFGPRSQDLRRWFELLKNSAIDYEDFRPENEKAYKLIIPNVIDEVMSKENIELCARLARNGAKLVVAANAGRYCPELPGEQFPLLKALGVKPPEGSYATDELDLSATVSAENPFFAKDSKLAFYSLAQLQRDGQSPEVREKFWLWPYRWIPQTDYFGRFKGVKADDGQALARFPDGGVALSSHKLGKGEILVFWGTPDVAKLDGFMAKAAAWASVANPNAGNRIPYMLEGDSAVLKRHYALLYQETAGDYVQVVPNTPDGDYFLDDIVSGERLGRFKGDYLRKTGLKLSYRDGESPLKIVRMMPASQVNAKWLDKYGVNPK
jgi:hypothetical protein